MAVNYNEGKTLKGESPAQQRDYQEGIGRLLGYYFPLKSLKTSFPCMEYENPFVNQTPD